MGLPGLKRAREAKGWTQKRLAIEIEVTDQMVWYLESGLREASMSTLRKIAEKLGVSVDDLLRPDQPDQPIPDCTDCAGTGETDRGPGLKCSGCGGTGHKTSPEVKP